MKFDYENTITVQLRARDVYERALVAGKTSPRDPAYEDRMEWAREALVALLEAIDVEDKDD